MTNARTVRSAMRCAVRADRAQVTPQAAATSRPLRHAAQFRSACTATAGGERVRLGRGRRLCSHRVVYAAASDDGITKQRAGASWNQEQVRPEFSSQPSAGGERRASPPHSAARGWAHLPCRPFKHQSCCLPCSSQGSPNPKLNPSPAEARRSSAEPHTETRLARADGR